MAKNKLVSRIKKFRKQHKITLKELSEHYGMSIANISKIERGLVRLSPETEGGIMTTLCYLRDLDMIERSNIYKPTKTKICPNCNSKINKNTNSCPECLVIFCYNCKKNIAVFENICEDCYTDAKNESEYKKQLNPIYHV